MNRSKFYIGAIVVLLLSNIVLISFILSRKVKRGHEPKEKVIEILDLDVNQRKDYEELITAHRASMRAKRDALFGLKNELYTQLSKPMQDQQTDSLLTAISMLQKEVEMINYDHFSDIRALCRPDQMDDFNTLAQELAQIFKPEKHGPPRSD
jgi:periplasmic protein CpxP/Spy